MSDSETAPGAVVATPDAYEVPGRGVHPAGLVYDERRGHV